MREVAHVEAESAEALESAVFGIVQGHVLGLDVEREDRVYKGTLFSIENGGYIESAEVSEAAQHV